jgi:hypothetical protein
MCMKSGSGIEGVSGFPHWGGDLDASVFAPSPLEVPMEGYGANARPTIFHEFPHVHFVSVPVLDSRNPWV